MVDTYQYYYGGDAKYMRVNIDPKYMIRRGGQSQNKYVLREDVPEWMLEYICCETLKEICPSVSHWSNSDLMQIQFKDLNEDEKETWDKWTFMWSGSGAQSKQRLEEKDYLEMREAAEKAT